MTRPTRLSVCRRSESGPRRGTYCFGRSCPKSRRTSGRSRTPSPPASTTAQIGEAGETRSSALGVSRAQAVVGFMGSPGAGTGRPEWGYAAAGTVGGFDFWGPAAVRDYPRRVPGRYLPPETPLGRGPPASLDDGVGAYQDRLRNHHAQRSSGLHVDHQIEPGRLLNGQIGGLGAAQERPVGSSASAAAHRLDAEPVLAGETPRIAHSDVDPERLLKWIGSRRSRPVLDVIAHHRIDGDGLRGRAELEKKVGLSWFLSAGRRDERRTHEQHCDIRDRAGCVHVTTLPDVESTLVDPSRHPMYLPRSPRPTRAPARGPGAERRVKRRPSALKSCTHGRIVRSPASRETSAPHRR